MLSNRIPIPALGYLDLGVAYSGVGRFEIYNSPDNISRQKNPKENLKCRHKGFRDEIWGRNRFVFHM